MKKNSFSGVSFSNILWLITGFTVPLVLHLATRIGIKESYYTLILFALACVILHYHSSKKSYKRELSQLLTGFTLFVTIHFFYNLILTYKVFQRWDFLCFYLFGKVGISSSDFYNPQVFLHVFNNLNLQSIGEGSFVTEVVNVGFWYPPPSMLLFLPLGLFNLQTGYFIWQTIIILFLIADIVLLLKFYFVPLYTKYNDIKILFPILILILLFPYITVMVALSQTISIFLFFLILLIRYIDNWRSGVFLAILVVIKPLAAIFLLYFLFFKKLKIIAAALAAGLILLIVTGLTFGFDVFLNYFTSPPTDRIPNFIYFEYSSLFGTLKKLQQYTSNYMNTNVLKAVYYFVSSILLAFTFYSSRKLSYISATKAFLIFIPLALMIYPATLFHYILMLLPVFLNIFCQSPLSNNIYKLVLLFCLFAIGYYSLFLLNFALWSILMLWPLVSRLIEKNNFLDNIHFNSDRSAIKGV